MSRLALIVAGVLAASSVHARMPAEPVAPNWGNSSHSASVAASSAAQEQQQNQGQAQGQQLNSDIEVGGAVSESQALGLGIGQGGSGGAGGSGQGGDGGDAQQGQSISVTGARQVGLLYLPTMIPPACGAAISAGHSNTRNATAGGISWTTERCWSVVIAQDFERMGAYREACELRRDVVRKQAKRAGIAIDCERIEHDMRAAIAAAAVVPAPTPNYATTEQLNRAFEAAMGKEGK